MGRGDGEGMTFPQAAQTFNVTPLFGFSSAGYTGSMNFQRTQRRSRTKGRYPNRIREYRLRAHMSQSALGAMIGRTRSSISLWERGLGLPSVPDLFKLAKALATLSESLYIGLYPMHRPEPLETNPVAA
jgi:DNA-binding XRE family transcriptional regulator